MCAVSVEAVPRPSWLSHTQRSLLAEMELQANRYGSPLIATQIGSSSEPAGTIHAYERRVGVWRTGIYDGALLLSPATSSAQTSLRLDAVAPALVDVDAMTLRIVAAGASTQAESPPIAEMIAQSARMKEVMALSDNYDGFLRTLGKHTRRNIAHARDWAKRDAINFSFVTEASSVASSRLSTLALLNMPRPVKPRRLLKTIRFLTAQPRPFQASLRQSVDHPFSVTGGFIEGDLALMAYQLNDRIFGNLSPSLMLRSFLVEALIARGVRYLAFVGGCAGLLYHQCAAVPAAETLIVRRTFLARTKCLACRLITDPRNRIIRLTPQFFSVLYVAGNLITASLDPIFS